MNRRDVISSAGAAALCAVLPAASSFGATPSAPALHVVKRLRVTCDWPEAAGGTFDTALNIARTIASALGGCTVEVVTANAATEEDFSFGSEHDRAATDPALALIAGLPGRFALPPLTCAQWLTTRGESLWHEAAMRVAPSIPLYAGCEGERPALWSRHEISSLAGLKVAGAAGLYAELLAAAGATPVHLPAGEWVAALQSGAIDAVHVAALEDGLVLGLPRHARFCLEGALASHGGPLALRIPVDRWRAMPAQVQHNLRIRAAEAGLRRTAKAVHNRETLLDALIKRFGMRVHKQAHAGLQRTIDRVSEAIVADCAGRDALCRQIGGASMTQHVPICTITPEIS